MQLVFSVCGTRCPHLLLHSTGWPSPAVTTAHRGAQQPAGSSPLSASASNISLSAQCRAPAVSSLGPAGHRSGPRSLENGFASRRLHVSICVQLQLTDSLAFTTHTSHSGLVFWALSRSRPWALSPSRVFSNLFLWKLLDSLGTSFKVLPPPCRHSWSQQLHFSTEVCALPQTVFVAVTNAQHN